MLGKMPGDEWQRFASLRLYYGYMFTQPGKKLLFMGNEIGQVKEWSHEESIEWHILQYPLHNGLQRWVKDLNTLYRSTKSLHETDFDHHGYEWIDFHDWASSIVCYIRKEAGGKEILLAVCNATPVLREGYRVGVPVSGYWNEVLNSDAEEYGGTGRGNLGGCEAYETETHHRPFTINISLPPLSIVIFKKYL